MSCSSGATEPRSGRFAEAMLALAQDPDSRHIIILGTRPDNLSLISAIGGFGKLVQRNQVLMSFTNRELRQMVEEPAKRVGLKYDDGVVDRLLLDVQGDPAVLSLLRFNLTAALEPPSGQSDHPRDLRQHGRWPPGDRPTGGADLCLTHPRATEGRQARVPEAGPAGRRRASDLSASAAKSARIPGSSVGCDECRAGRSA